MNTVDPDTLPRTFSVVVDGQSAAWSRYGRLKKGTVPPENDVAHGVLAGDEELVAVITAVLRDPGVHRVRVLPPNLFYDMTPGRDTAPDVAAAMIYAGGGRSLLSPEGWAHLYSVVDTSPPDGGPDESDESSETVY